MPSGFDVDHADQHVEIGSRSVSGRIRRTLANVLTALTVNAAIILAVPQSNGRNPAPIVLQHRRPLIDGRWEEGEFIAGDAPMVAIVDLEDPIVAVGSSRWISPN